MTAVKWHEGRMAGFDLETTSVDPHTARIVTAAVVHRIPGARPRTISWVIDPGCEIPAEAAEVHGWDSARLADRLQGREALRITAGRDVYLNRADALFEIAGQLGSVMGHDVPVVVASAPYDLTLIEAELVRHGVDTLASRPSGIRGVVDPQVIEKQFDPYRKVNRDGGCQGGKYRCGGCGSPDKTLTSLCAHYGVTHVGAHDASGDALAAVRLVGKLAEAWPEIARWKLATLHEHQVTWRRTQADGLRSYFDKNGIEHDGVCGEFPVHTQCAPESSRAVA